MRIPPPSQSWLERKWPLASALWWLDSGAMNTSMNTGIALVDKGLKLGSVAPDLSVSYTAVTLLLFSFKVRAKAAFTWGRKWLLDESLNIT